MIPASKHNVISCPRIEHVYNTKHIDRSKLPHVKFISIFKSFESKIEFNLRGTRRQKKVYGIGVLTDDNIYYYSELYIQHIDLTKTLENNLKSILVTWFRIDEQTSVVLSRNMNSARDPINLFVDLMGACTNCKVSRVEKDHMINRINGVYHYVRFKGGKKTFHYHRNEIMKRILKWNAFEFITNPNWKLELEVVNPRSREAQIGAALGILFLHVRKINNMYNQHRIENRKNGIPKFQLAWDLYRKRCERGKKYRERKNKRKGGDNEKKV